MKIAVGDLSKFDIERAVIPAIMYARADSDEFYSRAIAIGWWKWGIRISHVWWKD